MVVFSATACLNHTSFSDLTNPNLYGKSGHYTCKSVTIVPVYRNKILHSHCRGGRGNLASKIVAHGVPRENEDAERLSAYQFSDDDDHLFIFTDDDDDDCSTKEPGNKESAASLVQSSIDLQQTVLKQGNQETLLDKLKAVQLHILAMEQWNASRLKLCHRNYTANAANLIHYMALKGLNVEQLKDELSSNGLLNLDTVNPYVLSSLSACIHILTSSRSDYTSNIIDSSKGPPINKSLGYQKEELAKDSMMKRAYSNRNILLGTLQGQRMTHIMVTIGEEAVENDTHIRDLINTGTSIFRINCAHGNPDIWSEIIRRVKKSSQHLEKPCRIIMDLAGPKLRTGKLKAGPCVVKISPKRNAVGNVVRPAQVWLSPRGAGPPPAHVSPDAILYIDGDEFLSKLKVDDSVRFADARGDRRTLRISNKYSIFSGAGYMAECSKTAYVESGTVLYLKEKRQKSTCFVVDVPPAEQFVRLRVGDLLVISRDSSDEESSSTSSAAGAHRLTCPSGYLFDSVKPGEPIAFDDGKIWGVIKGTSISEVVVSITHAGLKGSKLGSEKSINIPESDIRYEGLTSKDLMDLDFVAAHADMVGISFVRDVHDIVVLRQELEKRKYSKLGVVLKIETKGAVEKLPLLILEAMKSTNPLGVMIARGDLVVECGWEKLGDIQEEIISTCGAANVPVILATQVLESLIKSGVPTRAEITDAANGRRASCVMLNKGKNVLKAVSILDTILSSHSNKTKAEQKPFMLSSNVH